MSEELKNEEVRKQSKGLLDGALKHVRVVTLAATLVPLATIAASTLQAQSHTASGQVPEPTSIVLLGTGVAGLAGLAATRLKRKK